MTMNSLAVEGVSLRPATDDDAVDGVQPHTVALPTTTEQVAQVLRATHEAGMTVVPRGAGTKLSWGQPPRACDVVLDLSAMDAVLEHEPGDLIATAQAGTPLATIQQTVAAAGQRLAVDEMVAGTTVGGLIASNPSGPQRMAHGTVRDLLIGVTVVRADGVVAKAGGKVVKNVAGYDLGKLLIGSFGTLAVITQATFRLHPVPPAATWFTKTCESPSAAADLLATLVSSQAVPAAVELDADPVGPSTVSVLLEGTEQGVAQRAQRISALLGDGAEQHDTAPATAIGYPGKPDTRQTLVKLTCQISAVAEIAQAAVDAGLQVRGSAGTGVLYAAAAAEADAGLVASALHSLRLLTARRGGAAVVVDAPPAVKTAVDVWGPVGGLDLMRRLKHRFDPNNSLAPGRFVGGI